MILNSLSDQCGSGFAHVCLEVSESFFSQDEEGFITVFWLGLDTWNPNAFVSVMRVRKHEAYVSKQQTLSATRNHSVARILGGDVPLSDRKSVV